MSDTYLIDSRNLIYHFKRVTELLSINGVWKGDRREENYKFIPKYLSILDCRKNYRMNEVNRYLHHLKEDNVSNVNFI